MVQVLPYHKIKSFLNPLALNFSAYSDYFESKLNVHFKFNLVQKLEIPVGMPDFKLEFEVFLGFENDEFLRECQQGRKERVFVGVALKIMALIMSLVPET